MVVTNTGPAFISKEFRAFLQQNGIKHVRTSPYHPSSNGLTERAIQPFKAATKKCSSVPLPTCLARFLFQYRITHDTTTPCRNVIGKDTQIGIGLALPLHQPPSAESTRCSCQAPGFPGGRSGIHEEFHKLVRWMSGEIASKRGPLSYGVKLQDGQTIRRHIDHILQRDCNVSAAEDAFEVWPNSGNPLEAPPEPQECPAAAEPAVHGATTAPFTKASETTGSVLPILRGRRML